MEVRYTGVSAAPHSAAVRNPVHSPAPLSTAPPAGSGPVVGVLGQQQTGHPGAGDEAVRRGGRSRGRARPPRRRARELVGPVGRAPISIPRSRARGMRSSCRKQGCPGGMLTGCTSRWSGRPRHDDTCPATRSGSACRHLAPRSPSASTSFSTRWPGTRSTRRPRTATRCSNGSTPASCSPSSRALPGRGPRRRTSELVGQDRVVPYFFPTAALLSGMEPTPGERAARADRAVTATTR